MLSLATGQLFNTPDPTVREDLPFLDRLSQSSAGIYEGNIGLRLRECSSTVGWDSFTDFLTDGGETSP
jgi:hypothetical protein